MVLVLTLFATAAVGRAVAVVCAGASGEATAVFRVDGGLRVSLRAENVVADVAVANVVVADDLDEVEDPVMFAAPAIVVDHHVCMASSALVVPSTKIKPKSCVRCCTVRTLYGTVWYRTVRHGCSLVDTPTRVHVFLAGGWTNVQQQLSRPPFSACGFDHFSP